MTVKTQTWKTPGCNKRLAQGRLTWLIEHSTSLQDLWCSDSFVLQNLPLRQAPKLITPPPHKHLKIKVQNFLKPTIT